MSRIELELPQGISLDSQEGQRLLREATVSLGVADVKDCFHRMIMPEEMSKYFCFDAVRACDVGLTGQEVDG
eukprot:12449359-Heterocapsa_arctica.AAC.1